LGCIESSTNMESGAEHKEESAATGERKDHKVFETAWFSIEALTLPASVEPYYRISCKDAVSILAITPDERIVVIRQYRHAIGDFIYELPSGYVDEGESPLNAAVRELAEETGFACQDMTSLGSLRAMPSRINNNLHFFFGKDANQVQRQLEEDRGVEVLLIKSGELKSMIREGAYNDMSGMALVFLAQLHGYV